MILGGIFLLKVSPKKILLINNFEFQILNFESSQNELMFEILEIKSLGFYWKLEIGIWKFEQFYLKRKFKVKIK